MGGAALWTIWALFSQSVWTGDYVLPFRRTTMDPLRLATFTSGPPPAIEPTTFRFDTEPRTVVPRTLTEPDPVLASSVNGTVDSVAMSMPPDPEKAFQSRWGTP